MRLNVAFRTRLILAFLGLALVTAAVVLHQAWRGARAAQLRALQAILTTTTGTVAPGIDGDAHAALDPTRPGAMATPAYRALRELAVRVRAAQPRFREVFTISTVDPPGPGVGRLVLTARDEEVGRTYDYARFPAMVRALSEPAADDDITTDEYGSTLSGYAPIRDRAGRTVGLLGVDVDGSTVEEMRSRLLGILALGAAGAVVLAAALGWFFATRISRPVQVFASAMDRVAAGDYGTRVTWRGSDEFERLAGEFNRMVEGLDERQRLKQALQIAMEIQQRLLPAGPPTVPGVDLAGFSEYCDETGGDYFDYPRTWEVSGGRVALTVGDVTGHGIGAALLMSTGRAVLRTHAERDVPPGELLSVANHHLAQDAGAGRFMTLFYGVLDPKAGTLVFANAGQGGCFVLRAASGRVETLEASGPPLGVVDGVPYGEATVEGLRPGDLVVLSSDGIWETVDASGARYEIARLEALVRENAGLGAAALTRLVHESVDRFRGAGPQADDVTLVVAKVVPEAGPTASA